MKKVSTKKTETIKIAIFYKLEIEPSKRNYWVGTKAKDGSCERVIKEFASKGAKGLSDAKKYMSTL
jgi:hypothetical protein